MKRSAIVVVAAAALIGALVWQGVRGNDAPEPPPVVVEDAPPKVTRAETRVSRKPAIQNPASIHGTVVRGREDVAVTGHPVELLRDGDVLARATTDGAGRFVFRAVEPAVAHEVRVAAAGCQTVRVTGVALLPSEHRSVGELYLEEPRRVRVVVTDEYGAAVPGAVVDVFRERPNALAQHAVGRAVPPPTPIQTVEVDERGEAELHTAYGARHAIVAHAPGYAHAALAQIEIALVGARGAPLRLVLGSPATLTGSVVDAAGEPVPGATVLARPPPRHWGMHGERALSTAVWQITTANESGAFRFDTLAPGPVEICCARPGGLPSGGRVLQMPEVDDVRLVLAASATIEGTARTVDGKPLAGVTVRTATDASSQRVVTDAEGRWSTPGLPAGELVHVDVIPRAGWLGPRERGSVLQPAGVIGAWYQKRLGAGERLEITATFERAATVTGRVTVDGKAEAGAVVRVVTLAAEGRRARQDTTRAGPDGTYRLTSVTPGRVVVLAVPSSVTSDEEYYAFPALWEERFGERDYHESGPADAGAIDIAEGTTTRLDIEAVLAAGYAEEAASRIERRARMEEEMDDEVIRIVGRVTTADGVPLRGAMVVADDGPASEADGSRFAFDAWKAVQVGADGRFEGTVPWYGDLTQVHMTATDARHGVVSVDAIPVESDGVPTFRCDLELPTLPTFAGRVMHAGQPIANADVRAGGAVVARTDADGAFRVPFTDGGVSIRAAGFLTAHEVLYEVPDSEPVVIELVAAGVLTGVVTDESGTPVAGIRVLPVDADDDPIEGYAEWEYWASRPTPVTAADGRFRVDHIPARGAYLRITSADREALATAPFTAGPFDVADGDVEIVVRPPRSLTGRVLGPDGEPVEGARIRCVPADPHAETASTRSDESGGFSFTSLQSGAYEVAAIPREKSGLQAAIAQISEDQEHVELALAQSVYISGTARWRDGSPFRPALRLVPLDPVPDALADTNDRFDPEDDGTFRAEAADGMRYAIEVYLRNWKGSVTLTGGEQVLAGTSGVVLTAARVTDRVDGNARAAGTVAGAIVDMGGEPIAGADVIIAAASQDEKSATSDADGRFRVEGMDAEADETVSVVVYAAGRGTTQLDDVKIGDTSVRLALPIEKTIAGRFLLADGEPAVGYVVRALRTSNPVHDLWRAAVSEEEGRFELTGLSRGTWTLDAIAPDGNTIHLGTTRAGKTKLLIRLPE